MITYPKIIMTVGGVDLNYSGADIITAELVEEIDPVSLTIPFNVLEFTLLDADGSLSMFSSGNLLTERLPIMVYENIDGADVFIGKFYLEKWKNASEYKVELRAIDIIGTLAATEYDGGFWGTNTTLENILKDVLLPVDVLYTIDDSIKSIELKGWIPPGDYRAALQQICFAANATASAARSDRLNISPTVLPSGPYNRKLTENKKLYDQPIELLPLVTSIELVSHNYSQGTEIQDIFSQYLEAGRHKIVFNEPYYSIIIDGPGYTPAMLILENGDLFITENGDFLEVSGEYNVGPNAVYLDMTEAGIITITGYPWLDNKRSFIFHETGLTQYFNKNALLISDATMVSKDNAQAVLNKIRDYYRQRYKQEIVLLPSESRTGDILLSSTFFSAQVLGMAVKMNIDMAAGFLQDTEVRGIEPIYVLPSASPVRQARTGIGVSGADMMFNNQWRKYG